jgi:hypothetical protein
MGGAALGSDPVLQFGQRGVFAGRQRGRAAERGHRQPARVGGREAQFGGALFQRRHEMEHVARPAAGHRGNGVDHRFAGGPDPLAHGGEQRVHPLSFRRAASRRGVQAGHAQAHLGRRVRHGAHDARVAAQPIRQRRELHPRRDADHGGVRRQVQPDLPAGLAQDLRLGGQHAQRGIAQFGAGGCAAVQPASGQGVTGGRIGLDHQKVGQRPALAEQAVDEGAGHVAAADENDLFAHSVPVRSAVGISAAAPRPRPARRRGCGPAA